MPDSKPSTRAAEMAARMTGIVKPAEPEPEAPKRPARRRADRAAPMPAEQPKPERYSERFSLTITPEQKRALGQARLEDGVEGTYRVRAAVALWMEDPKLRARIDKLARTESQRDKQSRGYR